MTKNVTMNVTPRFAESVVAQVSAAAVLDSLKVKKTDKIAKMKPAVKLVKSDRNDHVITLQVKNGKQEGTTEITTDKIGNRDLKPEVAEQFSKLIDAINLDKFGELVIAKANKNIETAAKLSAAAPSNPNLYRQPKKAAKEASLLF